MYYYKFGSFSIPSNVKEGLVVYGLVARGKGIRASHWMKYIKYIKYIKKFKYTL